MKIKALILAAGYGDRLKPLTNYWPKCLMPIDEMPLLEIWLDALLGLNLETILVNTHYFSDEVSMFLNKPKYNKIVKKAYERNLLGSAGTIRENYTSLTGSTLLLIHGDNFSTADLEIFFEAHQNRPQDCLMTMMTFGTNDPTSCGIVELDDDAIAVKFHEKVANPPGNLANAAVYLIEQEVLDFVFNNQEVNDFSNEVIPNFLGRINTWHNKNHHIDIGTPKKLFLAQKIGHGLYREKKEKDNWDNYFKTHIIHEEIMKLSKQHVET